jgi:protein tyrosine/serine phosphatase
MAAMASLRVAAEQWIHAHSSNNLHLVDAHQLYRSAQLSPSALLDVIKSLRIKTVVNLRDDTYTNHLKEREVCVDNHVIYTEVPMSNTLFSSTAVTSPVSIQALLLVYASCPRPILVHCKGGADRTGEAAALWVLTQQRHNTSQEAVDAALKQLDVRYGHVRALFPAKDELIRNWFTRYLIV